VPDVLLTSEAQYIIFVPGFTILAFLIGTIAAFVAMSAKQDPTEDEPSDGETSH
jgi:hypothetical protein